MQYRFFYFSPINLFKFYWDKIPFLHRFFGKKKTIVSDPNYIFYEKNKQLFFQALDRFSPMNKNVRILTLYYNNNIDVVFYNKKDFQEYIKEEGNNIEKIWRTRILMVNSPRGNIIMFYDAYKQGFAYYSDSNGIPYHILNAVAMKYVIKFRCMDFFIDNNITQEFARKTFIKTLNNDNLINYDSPLIPIYYTEDKSDENKNNKKSKVLHNSSELPFAKFKNYNSVNKTPLIQTDMVRTLQKNTLFTKIYNYFNYKIYIFKLKVYNILSFNKPVQIKEEVIYDKEYVCNKFIHLGKLSNFQLLQKSPIKNTLNGFNSTLLEGLQSNAAVQKEVLNYSNYKKMLTLQQS